MACSTTSGFTDAGLEAGVKHTILIVDDEPVQRRLLEAAVVKAGHSVCQAGDGHRALELLDGNRDKPSVIVLDLVMPGMDGMAFLEKASQMDNPPPVIVQTAKGGIETVVGAMRLGAFDFVVKPVAPDRLTAAIDKALKFHTARKAPASRKRKQSSGTTFENIVANSPAMEPIMAMARKASGSNIPVLIEGESGTGKELVASAIHEASTRAGKAMVTVNCGALPENIVESILFGHEKGAFTGASDKHVGKFQEADGGTLFLDEIGELPLDLQVKMLRAIQEGEIDPVGASRSIKVDVRLISATNRNLLAEVKAGRFREDLFYRLNVLPMTLPPLRERKSDVERLLYHFVKKITREENRQEISAITPDVIAAMTRHDWPGNIRELENAVFRAIVLCEGEELTIAEFPQIASQLPDFRLEDEQAGKTAALKLDSIDTPNLETPESQFKPEPVPAGQNSAQMPASTYGMVNLVSPKGQVKTLEELEGEAIRFAIEIYNGRMSEVARRLGIGRSTLYRKMKEHEIEDG